MLFFLSSTFKDLQEEREKAQEALKGASAEPWGMEFFASEPTKPLDICLREVRNCGAVLLIAGHYAGSIIEETPGMTYTRAEIEEALRLKRPIFPFIKTEHGKFVNKETDPDKRKALDDFIAMIGSSPCTPAYFE